MSNKATIDAWVARDKDTTLLLHADEPYRQKSGYQRDDKPDVWESDCASFLPLTNDIFPTITWESEPKKVKVTIELDD